MSAPSIITAIRDENLFRPFLGENLHSWRAWQACLRTIYGLPIKSTFGRKIVRAATGRDPRKLPREGFDTSLLLCGRRSGKSRISAVIGAYSACLAGLHKKLSPGEPGVIAILCPRKDQGEIVKNYLQALFEKSPLLKKQLTRQYVRESFWLKNNIRIQVLGGDARHIRGHTLLAAICDEVCWFGTEANSKIRSDVEVIRAIAPSLTTTQGRLIAISSPYAKRGYAWEMHQKCYGKDDAETLIWQAPSLLMNETISKKWLEKKKREDPAGYLSEYEARFRDDVGEFIPPEVVSNLVIKGRTENFKQAGIKYHAFCDLSGGRGDGAALAIAHKEGRKIIHDGMYSWKSPFNPHEVCQEIATRLGQWNLTRVTSDAFAGDFVTESFKQFGITCRKSPKPKRLLYSELLPVLTAGEIEILDNRQLIRELCALERYTRAGGADIIDHPPRGTDDSANVLAGVCTLCSAKLVVVGAGGF